MTDDAQVVEWRTQVRTVEAAMAIALRRGDGRALSLLQPKKDRLLALIRERTTVRTSASPRRR